jgi:hypothetical protein
MQKVHLYNQQEGKTVEFTIEYRDFGKSVSVARPRTD